MSNLQPNAQIFPTTARAKFVSPHVGLKAVNLFINEGDNKLYAIFAADNSIRIATAGVDGTITFPVAP